MQATTLLYLPYIPDPPRLMLLDKASIQNQNFKMASLHKSYKNLWKLLNLSRTQTIVQNKQKSMQVVLIITNNR